MAIVNGYCTLPEFKNFAIPRANIDATDDSVLEGLIESASRIIDSETGRQFFTTTASRFHSVPQGTNNKRMLWLDGDLQAVGAAGITNGDGETVLAADYYLEPRNASPKYAVVLKKSSYEYWKTDADGDNEYVIEVPGTWGYCATGAHPDDIREACMMIALSSYLRRSGQNLSERSYVTVAGVVITPEDIPGRAWNIIKSYRKIRAY